MAQNSPHRRHVLMVKIEADSKELLIADFKHVLYMVRTKFDEEAEIIDSIMGGSHASNVIMYHEDQNVTHESYWEALEAYMRRVKGESDV